MKRHFRIYIEGGAEGRDAGSDFRRSWQEFLVELRKLARANGFDTFKVVRGKSRRNAFDQFRAYGQDHPDTLCVLLVDSEGVVPQEAQVWDIVANRQDDKWPRPSWATEHHLYLMVQAVETWLLTDQEKLKEYFGRGFREGVLPSTNLEARSKDEVEKALHTATEYSTKGRYKHAHANQLIGKVRQDRIKTLRHGRRLFDSLGGLIRRERQKP